MSPAGKIINIDAFKRKESGLKSSKSNLDKNRKKRRGGFGFVLVHALIVIGALTYIMIPHGKEAVPVYPVDSIAPINIKAPEDMLVEDKESTEKNRLSAAESVLDIYDFDSAAEKTVSARIEAAFKIMAQGYMARIPPRDYDLVLSGFESSETSADADTEEMKERLASAKDVVAGFESSEAFQVLEKEFLEKLGAPLDDRSVQTLRYYHYWPKIGKWASLLVEPILAKGVVARKAELPASSFKGIMLHDIATGAERALKNFNSQYDIPEAEKKIREEVAALTPADRPRLRKLVTLIAVRSVKPTLTINHKETDIRKKQAAGDVKPVFFRIQRGEMIVREGERITPAHAAKLRSLSGLAKEGGIMGTAAGVALFNALLISLAIVYVWKYHEEAREEPKIQTLIAWLMVTHMALIWGAESFSAMLIQQTPEITLQTYMLAAPLALGPMIISIFFTTELTVLFTIVVSALTVLMLPTYPVMGLLTIVGGMICAYQVRFYTSRSAVLKMGVIVGLANALLVVAFGMVGAGADLEKLSYDVSFAFMGGIVVALFVSGALPLVESMFPVVSDIKLLELTNMNHPLLRRMILEAPGTYHHSIMVGNLAEEACKVIGANALLARAGALFHDIGKMKKSEYFVENQRVGANPHDKLAPSMSALILGNHIKDGLELARQHKLLPQITAMIPEHHGTQLMRVFYRKAKDAEDASRSEVKEEDYRYPGPIPSSPESACVALADSIEASARALPEPSQQKLKELVTEVINDKFVQGQLDNSHLTLHDLALVTESFTHVLSGIHHHRIQYPGQKPSGSMNVAPESQAAAEPDA